MDFVNLVGDFVQYGPHAGLIFVLILLFTNVVTGAAAAWKTGSFSIGYLPAFAGRYGPELTANLGFYASAHAAQIAARFLTNESAAGLTAAALALFAASTFTSGTIILRQGKSIGENIATVFTGEVKTFGPEAGDKVEATLTEDTEITVDIEEVEPTPQG